MAKLTTLQHFNSVSHLAASFGVTLPRSTSPWRLVQEPLVGCVNGVPSLRGVLLATDGVIALVARGGRLERAHLDWFIPDDNQPAKTTIKQIKAKQSVQTPRQPKVDISEFA